jgi:hypothetical protein
MARDHGLQANERTLEKAGQAAEGSDLLRPEDVVEQEKNKRRQARRAEPVNPDSRTHG